jgi:hypothetical protein
MFQLMNNYENASKTVLLKQRCGGRDTNLQNADLTPYFHVDVIP